MTQPLEISEAIRLISSSQGALLGYILALCPDRTSAQDILQETNLVLWEKISQFHSGTNFKAWSFRIAYLQTLAYFKRQKRDRRIGFSTDLIEQLASKAEASHCDFESRQLALRKCLQKVPEGDVAILQAYYGNQISLEEIGKSLNRSQGAMKQVLFRIRRNLRTCIERCVDGGLENA